MKLNENCIIKGHLVILVPYEKYHVPKYHEWMKSEELQFLTASEPLSLEEEFNMQKCWRNDPDKCTFIVLSKVIYDQSKDEINAMVGDTNIFLKNLDGMIIGEIEIMVAESSARNKGLGKEGVLLMLRYGIENLNINKYEAKIGMSNSASISLFSKIGFVKDSESNIFKEITFCREVTESWIEWLKIQTAFYSLTNSETSPSINFVNLKKEKKNTLLKESNLSRQRITQRGKWNTTFSIMSLKTLFAFQKTVLF